MFQFPGFAFISLCIQPINTWLSQLLSIIDNNSKLSGGLPHSEIHGSKPILGSPWLIAEYHVFHRLLLPRHSPNALLALDLIQEKQDYARFPDQKHTFSRALSSKSTFERSVRIALETFSYKNARWLVYLTWTKLSFWSGLACQMVTLTYATNNSDVLYLSKRCQFVCRTDIKTIRRLL